MAVTDQLEQVSEASPCSSRSWLTCSGSTVLLGSSNDSVAFDMLGQFWRGTEKIKVGFELIQNAVPVEVVTYAIKTAKGATNNVITRDWRARGTKN
eukprot:2747674-Amphidinium_carterae.1